MYVLGFAINLLLFFFVPCVDRESCSQAEVTIQTIGVFIFKFTGTYVFLFHMMQVTELYPSQVKSIATQVLSIVNALSYLLVPSSLLLKPTVSLPSSVCPYAA